MKNFLTIMLLAIAIVIPTSSSVSAADVPDFANIGGGYLTFTGKEYSRNHGSCEVYGYDCNIDLNENFAEQYINLLLTNYNFRSAGYFVQDNRRSSAQIFENWLFVYTGSKSINMFMKVDYSTMQEYHCHLTVRRNKNWQTGITHFSIYVATGLSYGN